MALEESRKRKSSSAEVQEPMEEPAVVSVPLENNLDEPQSKVLKLEIPDSCNSNLKDDTSLENSNIEELGEAKPDEVSKLTTVESLSVDPNETCEKLPEKCQEEIPNNSVHVDEQDTETVEEVQCNLEPIELKNDDVQIITIQSPTAPYVETKSDDFVEVITIQSPEKCCTEPKNDDFVEVITIQSPEAPTYSKSQSDDDFEIISVEAPPEIIHDDDAKISPAEALPCTEPTSADVEVVSVEASCSSEVNEPSSVKVEPVQPVDTTCSINIKFKDEPTAELYMEKFLKFIHNFIELQVAVQDNLSIHINVDQTFKPEEWVVVDQCEPVEESLDESILDSPSKKHKKRSKAKKELFILDAKPSADHLKTDLRYTSKFTISTEKKPVEDAGLQRQGCFNCGEPHNLRDCTKPKDFAKINAARQKKMAKVSRYHLEDNQKYSHLKPGKLSAELRKALGLRKHESPHFIYLMRRMGYPPGWLEEAKVVNSNLDMFDIDGNHVKASSSQIKGLDRDKIIDFPGFNVPMEKGTIDEYRAYGVAPFSEDFSKEAMIKFFEQQFAKEVDNLETCDMDISLNDLDEEENTPKDIKKLPSHINDDCRDSPSLIDLEKQKLKLLEELNEAPKVDNENSLTEALTVKTSYFGTPILKSASPYIKLPNSDNFSKDVSPVINFENLPNSTGKYEQMTDVLQKVRSTLKKINSNV